MTIVTFIAAAIALSTYSFDQRQALNAILLVVVAGAMIVKV